MSLRLSKLEVEGFKSFKKKATITFPQSGVVLISGKYKNSQVSSGSGKSSILEAIAFALDISSTPATELKNWDSKKMSVVLTLTDGTNTYEITKDPKLSLKINDIPYESMATGAKEKLQSILGASEDVLKAITYRQQRTQGKFINATDSELKKFLTQPLGLDEIEKAAEAFAKEAASHQNQLEMLARELNLLKGMASYPITNEEIIRLTDALSKAKVEYNDLLSKGSSSNASQSIKDMDDNLRIIDAELQKSLLVQDKAKQYQYQNTTLREQILALKRDIETLSSNSCPTCEREWNTAQEAIKHREDKLKSLLSQMETNIVYIKNSEILTQSITDLQSQKTQLQSKRAELNAQIMQAQKPLQIAKALVDQAEYSLSMTVSKKREQESLMSKMLSLESNAKEVEVQFSNALSAAKLLGRNGFLGTIFDEILIDIESRCNDMIGSMPNASHFAINISSDKVTKTKGTVKKEITVNITKEGKDVSLRSLSGGQQCSLELCADLASAESIRSRSGSLFNWICLDEALDGLGTEEKHSAINMIRQRVKGLILIIDHATEIKEGFEKVIEIEYDGKESYVVAS